ncbi:MAG: hypothetical protein M3N45_16365 [Actinomycetota bacterium]|nr:hypothetical protein [Actinomycetota bacterium]
MGAPDGYTEALERVEAKEETIAELKDRVDSLERQMEAEREARRRADTIIAQLSAANAEQARTIRQLEPPRRSSTGSIMRYRTT